MDYPTAPIVAGSLIGGYYLAQKTKNRQLGGVVLAAGGIAAKQQWYAKRGPVTTIALTSIYYGSFGASHPLAKKIGAWPAVLTAAAVSAGSAWALNDRLP